MNLSVHNDEDYGMSVAESQCSGLPTITTDWGGLASIRYDEMPEAAIFIPVKIGKRAKILSYEGVVESFKTIWSKGSGVDRKKLCEEAIAKLGVEKAGTLLKQIIARDPGEFSRFTPFFDKVLSDNVFSQTPYMDEDRNINQLYRDIYNSYVRHP